jgi:hypothetical protein
LNVRGEQRPALDGREVGGRERVGVGAAVYLFVALGHLADERADWAIDALRKGGAKRIAGQRGATRIDVAANPQAVALCEAVGFKPAAEAQTRFGPAPRMPSRHEARFGDHQGCLTSTARV